jgi:hypothetical protein
MSKRFPIALQTAGLAAISGGVALYSVAAGIIVAGVSAVLTGVALERAGVRAPAKALVDHPFTGEQIEVEMGSDVG